MVNKIYYELDDLEFIKYWRQLITRQALAEKIGCKAGSIAWKERLFTDEVRASFVFDRVHKKPETI